MGLTEEGIKPPKLIKISLMMTRKAFFAAVRGEMKVLNMGQLCPGFKALDLRKKNASGFLWQCELNTE